MYCEVEMESLVMLNQLIHIPVENVVLWRAFEH